MANQEPVRVDVEEERNLSEEYAALDAFHDSIRWRFWRKASQFWQVTDSVVIHKDMVVGVLPKLPKTPKRPLGFL